MRTGIRSFKSLETMRDLVREQLAPDNGVLQQTWLNEGHIGKLSIFFDDHALTKSSDGRLSNIFDGLLKTRGGGVVAVLAVPGYFESDWCLTEMIAAFELAEKELVAICFIAVGMTVDEIKNTPVMKETLKYVETYQAQIHSIEMPRIDTITYSDLNALADKISSLIVNRARSVVPGRSHTVCFYDLVSSVWNLVKQSQYKDDFLLRFNNGNEQGILPSLVQSTVRDMKEFLVSRIDDSFSRSYSKLEAFEKKWSWPWCVESRWLSDKHNLIDHAELVRSSDKKRQFNETSIDVLFAVQIPQTSLNGIRKQVDEIVEVQKFGDMISTDNDVSAEFRKHVKSVLVTDAVDCMKLERQKSSIMLMCWVAEGCDEFHKNTSVATFVKSHETCPEVAIICMKYGAEIHAAKLLELGVKSVVSISMDAFVHGCHRFSEVARRLLLPLCTSILKENSVSGACSSVEPEASRMIPPVQVCLLEQDVNYSLRRENEAPPMVEPNVAIKIDSPRFADWKCGPDLSVDMADLDLLREYTSELLEQRSRKHRYRYFMVTPRQGQTASQGEWNHTRAVAMQIMCAVAQNNVHTDRVACADDAERVQRVLNRKLIGRSLLWFDFMGHDQMPFDSVQEWTEGIGSDAEVIFLITSVADMFNRVKTLLLDSGIVGDEEEIEVAKCLDLVEARMSGVLTILPWMDDNDNKHSVLEHVRNVPILRERISSVLHTSNGAWRERPIFVYRDDDKSTKLRFTVANLDELKRILDMVYVGKDGTDSFQLLADAFSLDVNKIAFDYSAFASHYERLILQLETPTKDQQNVISLCKDRMCVRIEGGAGTGKTFVALNMAQTFLLCQFQSSNPSRVLYICKTRSLACHFVKWLCLRVCGGHSMRKVLKLVFVLTAEDQEPVRFVKEKGKLFCEGVSAAATETAFGLMVVDESQDIFREDQDESGAMLRDTLANIYKGNPESKLILLSDIGQASVERSGIKYPNDNEKPVELNQVCRSSKHVIAGALAYQFPRKKKIGFSHCSDGLQLDSRIFSTPDSQVNYEIYAQKIVEAIVDIRSKFHAIELHDRIAIIVPDEDFRLLLWGRLKDVLNTQREALGQHVVPKRAIDASKSLVSREEASSRQESWIIVDSMSEMCGLERLIIFGVGLDEPIRDDKQRIQTVRSRIYRAMTRSHLMYYLINHRVEGGWFEWLDHLGREEAKFSFEAANRRTATDALTNLLSGRLSEHSRSDPASGRKKENLLVRESIVQRATSKPAEQSQDPLELDGKHVKEIIASCGPAEQAENAHKEMSVSCACEAPKTGTREGGRSEEVDNPIIMDNDGRNTFWRRDPISGREQSIVSNDTAGRAERSQNEVDVPLYSSIAAKFATREKSRVQVGTSTRSKRKDQPPKYLEVSVRMDSSSHNRLVNSGIWNMACHEAPRARKPLSHLKIVPAASKFEVEKLHDMNNTSMKDKKRSVARRGKLEAGGDEVEPDHFVLDRDRLFLPFASASEETRPRRSTARGGHSSSGKASSSKRGRGGSAAGSTSASASGVLLGKSSPLIFPVPPELEDSAEEPTANIKRRQINFMLDQCEATRFPFKKKLMLENMGLVTSDVPVADLTNTSLGNSLNKLSLSGNRLSVVPDGLVVCLPVVKTLDLSSCDLHRLPRKWNLPQLRRLNLSCNRLVELPDEGMLEGMPELQDLNMYGNKVTQILVPQNPKVLSKLETLNLGYNDLAYLPDDLDQLKNLRTLKIQNNFLEKVPIQVCKMGIRTIDVSSNPVVQPPIETCERGIANMKRYYASLRLEEQAKQRARAEVTKKLDRSVGRDRNPNRTSGNSRRS